MAFASKDGVEQVLIVTLLKLFLLIIILFRFVSENLKTILMRLEDDVCHENESDEHAELLKSLYVNHKVNSLLSTSCI